MNAAHSAAAIAHDNPRLRVVCGDPLPKGWIGKPWALAQGARQARGQWLLFTDADTTSTACVGFGGAVRAHARGCIFEPAADAAFRICRRARGIADDSVDDRLRASARWTQSTIPSVWMPRSSTVSNLCANGRRYEAPGGHAPFAPASPKITIWRASSNRGALSCAACRRRTISYHTRMYRSFGEIWTVSAKTCTSAHGMRRAMRLLACGMLAAISPCRKWCSFTRFAKRRVLHGSCDGRRARRSIGSRGGSDEASRFPRGSGGCTFPIGAAAMLAIFSSIQHRTDRMRARPATGRVTGTRPQDELREAQTPGGLWNRTAERRVTMDEITALAKRRGFIFQSSEIYGGIGGFYDYGPLGAVLKRNVKDAWWRDTVELRDDVVAFRLVDHHASAHVEGVGPHRRVSRSHGRLQSLQTPVSRRPSQIAGTVSRLRQQKFVHRAAQFQLDDAARIVGPMEDTASDSLSASGNGSGHLRQFQKHLPDGAQDGRPSASRRSASRFATKSRRAISRFACVNSNRPNWSISSPTTATIWRVFKEWVERRKSVVLELRHETGEVALLRINGRGAARIMRRPASTSSICFRGAGVNSNRSRIAAPTISMRTCSSPAKICNSSTRPSKKKYTPLLIESSAGMDRTTLTFLIDAYESERSADPNGKETERVVLHFHPHIAPVQVAVFSLARNKPELVEQAREHRRAALRRTSARSTTKATSVSSIAVKTKSARRSA